MLPYIDMVNYWPNPRFHSNFDSVQLVSDKYCVVSNWNRTIGQELFIHYSVQDFTSFFKNYGFVVENDPYASFDYKYSPDSCDKCYYRLYSDRINTTLVKVIAEQIGSNYQPEFEENTEVKLLNTKDFEGLLASLLIYRADFKYSLQKITVGLRETRRMKETSTDQVFQQIYSYAISSRLLLYSHLQVLEKKILAQLYQALLY